MLTRAFDADEQVDEHLLVMDKFLLHIIKNKCIQYQYLQDFAFLHYLKRLPLCF